MDVSPINFHLEDVDFSFQNEQKRITWLEQAITIENKRPGEINCVFCSDQYLHNMNVDYLNHDTFTDIITFNYVEGDLISGDLFISIDRVKDNAEQFNVNFETELNRVLIHGVLHLIGFNDKSAEDAHEIRAKEDFYLTLLAE